MGDTILKVDNLSAVFLLRKKSVPALHQISFSLNKGIIWGLVGESGSGKSITAKHIMRLMDPLNARITSGTVEFDGRDLLRVSEHEMINLRGNRMSMIFQEPMTALNPLFSCGNQIMETICTHSCVSKQEAWENSVGLLKQVGIPNPETRMHAYPHELSGGMRQRVMIAMALCMRPAILFADEPTTALDPTIQAQILHMIRSLQQEMNMSVLYITHDLGVVANLCQYMAVMYAGHLVELGSKDSIFNTPAHPYTRGLIHSIPKLHHHQKRLFSIPGNVPSLFDVPTGCPFHPRCELASSICRRYFPEMQTVSPEHTVFCHHSQRGCRF